MSGADVGSTRSFPGDFARFVLVGMSLVPIIHVPELIYPYVSPKALYVRVGVALALTALLWMTGSRVVRFQDGGDPVMWSLLSFLGLSFLAAILGPSAHHSIFGDYERMWGLMQWVALSLLYLLLRTFFRDSDWRVYLRCVLYVALAVALYGGYEYVLAIVTSTSSRTVSTLGNTGYLGAYMLLAAATALIVADWFEKRWRRIGTVLAILLFGALVSIAGNRTAFVGFLFAATCSMGLLIVTGVRISNVDIRTQLAVIGAVVMAAGVLFAVAPQSLTELPVVTRLAEVSPQSTSLLRRIESWEAALAGMRARPMTGWGLENFSLVYDRFVDPAAYRFGAVRVDRAHNVLLGKLVAAGVPGLLAYLAFWGALIGMTVHGWWSGRLRPLEAAGFVAAFTGYFVFLQMWFEDHSSAVLLIALAAFLRHRYSGTPLMKFKRQKEWSRGHVAVWGTVCVIFLAIALWTHGRSALAAHHMYQATASPQLPNRVDRFDQARQLEVPQHSTIALSYSTAMGSLGLTAGDYLRQNPSLRSVYRRGVTGAEQALNIAAARNPMNGRLDEARGRLAAGAAVVYGSDEIEGTAIQGMEAAIEKSPPIMAYRHFLAHLHARFGDRNAADRTLRETLDVYDGYGRTYYLMAQVDGGTVDEVDLRHLREAFWLGYRPEERAELRLVVDELLRTGRPAHAERLLSVYFASHYLPAVRSVADPYRQERREFFESVDADVPNPGLAYRGYELEPEDLTLLAKWPRAAMAAGECRRATLSMRLLINGLSEQAGMARVRPTLVRQLADMQKRCSG